MPLNLKLKAYERFFINGSLFENGPKASSITLLSDGVKVIRAKEILTEEDSKKSKAHELAYEWFLYHSGQKMLSAQESTRLGAACADMFPDLIDLYHRGRWFLLYKSLLKLLPE